MQTDVAAQIAGGALKLLGTPFRLHGRDPVSGLDCVGVVAAALACLADIPPTPTDYTLRGTYGHRISAFLDAIHFGQISFRPPKYGDILLLHPGPGQDHMAIIVPGGAVHAHAGLARVVLSPLPLPWPIAGHWRYIGE